MKSESFELNDEAHIEQARREFHDFLCKRLAQIEFAAHPPPGPHAPDDVEELQGVADHLA